MSRPSKRAFIGTDHRARSPKRRKFGTFEATLPTTSPPATHKLTSEYTTRDITWEEQLTLPARFHTEEGVWPARAILKERKRGTQIQYLVEWEPHPYTDEIFEPTWEPKKNLGQDLIGSWNKTKKIQQSGDLAYEPSQALPPLSKSRQSLTTVSEDSPQPPRTKRSRLVVRDSSSEIGADIDALPISITPSLASPAESSADEDFGPASPSLEISETQAQSSLSTTSHPPVFTIEIPIQTFSKSDYASLIGSSQQARTQSSPVAANHTPDSALRTRSTSKQLSAQTDRQFLHAETPQSRPVDHLGPVHQRLNQAIEGLDQDPIRVEIPASSEKSAQAHPPTDIAASPAFILEQSGSQSGSQPPKLRYRRYHKSIPGQPLSVRDTQASQPVVDSSIQNVSQSQLSGFHSTAHNAPGLVDTPKSCESVAAAPDLSPQTSSLWQFESQIPEVRQHVVSPTAKSHRYQRAWSACQPSSPAAAMDAPSLRQSPRLQSATPVSRTRSPQRTQALRRARTPQAFGETANADAVNANLVTSPLATAPPHIADYSSSMMTESYQDELPPSRTLAPQATLYETAFSNSAMPIHQSIEEEPQSSADSIASKASSSQVSLQNERIIPQVDGVSLPTEPVVGPGEYLIGLPAEGKVQSIYTDNINVKRKLIIKFIHRRDSVGSANGSTSRTVERNEMIELMERLQDTTTHIDLGLPGFTQYSIRSEQEALYAEYAGSKFVLLGHLVDLMKRVDCGLVIVSKVGAVQDLLADYLRMKHVQVRRHDRPPSARAGTPEALRDTLKIDIISTTADNEINLSAPPALMIAFDSSFDNQSAHIRRIRELYSKGRDQPLPVVHFLVTNSAEHIDRCLRKAMPSPQRLKLLVRGTYLGRSYLGGLASYVPRPSDEPEGRSMDVHDLQRAVRKSPNRKLQMVAAIVARAALSADFDDNWTLNTIPEVQYDELEDTPPTLSDLATTAGTAAPTPRDGRMRTRSPVSRSATPMGKKRLLDVDAASSILSKRQRLTPMRELTPIADPSREQTRIEQMQEQLKAITIELSVEKEERLRAEEARDDYKRHLDETKQTLQQWQSDHAALLRRYERQRAHNRTLHTENKRYTAANESIKTQVEKVRELNVKVRGDNTQLKADLSSARDDLTATGGDVAALETARSEARTAQSRAAMLEKSLENTKRDFEFTRQQYQQASNSAAELSSQNSELEAEVEKLKVKASDERRRLRELNAAERAKADLNDMEQFSEENRALIITVKKLEEENRVLKKGRGVQTRGSSVQPPGSPSLGGFGRRSRQASPAVGVRAAERDGQRGPGVVETLAVPGQGRDRVSAVRNEP